MVSSRVSAHTIVWSVRTIWSSSARSAAGRRTNRLTSTTGSTTSFESSQPTPRVGPLEVDVHAPHVAIVGLWDGGAGTPMFRSGDESLEVSVPDETESLGNRPVIDLDPTWQDRVAASFTTGVH